MSLLSIGLTGCGQDVAPVAEQRPVPVQAAEAKTPSLKDRIENLANYTVVTDKEEKEMVVASCDDFTNVYAAKVMKGDMKKLTLFQDTTGANYSLYMYAVPAYGLTESDFARFNKCSELASKQMVGIVDGQILFTYPRCSAGAIPAVNEPGYADWQACSKVEQDLDSYLQK